MSRKKKESATSLLRMLGLGVQAGDQRAASAAVDDPARRNNCALNSNHSCGRCSG